MNVVLSILLALILALPALAGETYVVTLRRPAVPQALAAYRPRPIMDMLSAGTKVPDRVQSSVQRRAYEAVQRHVLITIDASADLAAIRGLADVEDVRPLGRFTLHGEALTIDSLASDQYALRLIGAEAAWRVATGNGVVVGVLDTGIDWDHPDLVGALAVSIAEDRNGNGRFDAWPSTVSEGGVFGDLDGVDDDGNGVADDVIGYDFVDQSVRNIGDDRDRDPEPTDEQGHGTSVSGVVAATPNNRIGIAGLAHGARVRTLRAFDATGNAEEDDVAAALIYAALNGVDVVNMSFGDGVDSPMLRDAVRFASAMNVVLVASAGNTGAVSRQYPAGYPEVIAVASTNDDDVRSPFSSTGSLVALSAPGQGIVTTAVGSRYRTVNGTSFSAPYVAATAAMLLEQQPGRSPAEIRGTMQERSLDRGAPGWDPLYGAGRLRADAALTAQGPSMAGILAPRNESEVDAEATPVLVVRGTVRVAPFVRYTVDVGAGLEPAQWVTVARGSVPVDDDTLARIEVGTLASGLHTVRIAIECSDGRILQERARFTVIRPSDVRITKAELIHAWTTDRRTPVVTVRTSVPTILTAGVRTDIDTLVVSDVLRDVRSHSIVVADTVRSTTSYAITASLRSRSGVTVDTVMSIPASTVGAPSTADWRRTGSVSWAGYVLNDVRTVYGDGKPTVFMTDLSTGSFGRLRAMQYDGATWTVRDSTDGTWIPRGLCDANGNGLLEVFVHIVGRAVLFEQAAAGGNPFARVIFADSSGRQNGAGVADIDGDGREELLMLSDSGCTAVTYRNGRFERMGLAVNPSAPSFGNVNNRVDEISVASGDFDGDGAMDVAFGDTDGDLTVSTWRDGRFTTAYSFESDGGGGSGYVAAGDVDADGRPDIVFGVPDSTQPDADREYGRDVWTYHLIRATAPGRYERPWTQHISGVRYGIGYRNGVDVVQADATPGEEIVICAFPRMYIFGRTGASETIVPRWFQSDVVTPRFLSYDFDQDGLPELGFGVTVPGYGAMTNFVFNEADTTRRHAAPTSLRGRYVSDTSVVLDWMAVPNTRTYRIVESVNDGVFRTVDSTNVLLATRRVDPGVRSVRYAVVAVGSDPTLPPSQRSNVVSFTVAPRVTFDVLSPDSVTRSAVAGGVSVVARFTGPLAVDRIEASRLELVDPASGEGRAVAVSAVPGAPRDLVITFPPMRADGELALRVRGLLDATLRPVPDTTVRLRVVDDAPRPDEIFLASVEVVDPLTLRVQFSHAVDESALAPVRYTLDPVGVVQSVTRGDDRTVVLSLDASAPITPRGVTYALTAADVVNGAGAVMTTGPGRTMTFSVIATDVNSAYVYPHPVKLGRDDEVTFGGLPSTSTIDVFDASMRPLATLASVDGSGGIRWTVTDANGQRLPPGLYFYRVNGETLYKLVIER